MCLVAVSMVMSMLLAAPVVHYTTLHVVDAEPQIGLRQMSHCVEQWDSEAARRLYSVAVFVVLFCLPLVATASLYARIYVRLRLRRRRALFGHAPRNGSGAGAAATSANPFLVYPSTGSEPATAAERGRASPMTVASSNVVTRTNKTNRILAAIVVNFVVCWLPWHLFCLVTELDWSVVRGRYFELVELSLKCFAMLSACVNPLLYCWLNENLRRNIGSLSLRLNPFYRFTRSLAAAAGAGDVTDVPGGVGAAQGDLPRFQIQPPSCHSNAAVTGAAAGGDLAVLAEHSHSSAAGSDSPRHTSFLAVSEHRSSISSVAFVAHVRHTTERHSLPPPENTEL